MRTLGAGMNIAITTEVKDARSRAALSYLKDTVGTADELLEFRRARLPVGGDRTAVAGWIDVLDELSEALAVALGETGDGT
jgi:uncharacterized protein YfiM (DUF2279 family)